MDSRGKERSGKRRRRPGSSESRVRAEAGGEGGGEGGGGGVTTRSRTAACNIGGRSRSATAAASSSTPKKRGLGGKVVGHSRSFSPKRGGERRRSLESRAAAGELERKEVGGETGSSERKNRFAEGEGGEADGKGSLRGRETLAQRSRKRRAGAPASEEVSSQKKKTHSGRFLMDPRAGSSANDLSDRREDEGPSSGDSDRGANTFKGLLHRLSSGFDELLPATGGAYSRMRHILALLKSPSGELRHSQALTELCDILSVGTEESMTSFSAETFVPVLVDLMSPENDPDVRLLSARALTNMMDALPASSAIISHSGAPVSFCASLHHIEYMDLAEQSLFALEKLSVDHPQPIVRAGGFAAALRFFDFFARGIQRVAASLACNLCQGCPSDCFSMVSEVVSILLLLLESEDQRIRESAMVGFSRLADSFKHDSSKLEGMCGSDRALLEKTIGFITSSSRAKLSSQAFAAALRMLGTLARGSPELSNVMLQREDLLQGLRKLLEDRSSTFSLESLTVAEALLPLGKEIQEDEDLTKMRRMKGSLAIGMVSTRVAAAKRKFLAENPQLLKVFGDVLIPPLLNNLNSAVNFGPKRITLSTLAKFVHNAPADILKGLILSGDVKKEGGNVSIIHFSSQIASLLGENNVSFEVIAGLVLISSALEKLGSPLRTQLIREGVVFQLRRLASFSGNAKSRKVANSQSKSSQEVGVENVQPEPETKEKHGTSPKTESDYIAKKSSAILEAHFNGDSEDDCAESSVLIVLKGIGERLEKSTAVEQQVAALEELASLLNSEQGISTFELKQSALIQALLKFIESDKEVLGKLGRLRLLAETFAKANADSFQLLCSRVYGVLSAEDKLAICVHESSSGNAMSAASGLRQLTQPLKLRLRRAPGNEGGKHLQDYAHNVVVIDPFTTFKNVEDFLWQRVKTQAAVNLFTSRILAGSGGSRDGTVDVDMVDRSEFQSLFDEDEEVMEDGVFDIDDEDEEDGDEDEDGVDDEIEDPANNHEGSGFGDDLDEDDEDMEDDNDDDLSVDAEEFVENLRSSVPVLELDLDRIDPNNKSGSSGTAAAAANADAFATASAPASAGSSAPASAPASTPRSAAAASTASEPPVGSAAASVDPSSGPALTPPAASTPSSARPASRESSRTKHAAAGSSGTAASPRSYAAAVASAAAASPRSYAAAVGSENAGSSGRGRGSSSGLNRGAMLPLEKLLFEYDKIQIPKEWTIFQAVLARSKMASERSEGAADGEDQPPAVAPRFSSSRRSCAHLWEDIHTLTYSLSVRDPETVPGEGSSEGADAPAAGTSRNGSSQDENMTGTADVDDADDEKREEEWTLLGEDMRVRLPASNGPVDIADGVKDLIRLSQYLHFINGHITELTGGKVMSKFISEDNFVSRSITSKILRQMSDPLSLCGGMIPQWIFSLSRQAPFLLTFEVRLALLQSTALGLARTLHRLQARADAAAANGGSNGGRGSTFHREGERRVGRISRQKVRIDRSRILESAIKVMGLCASQRSMLEIEYYNEAGTGLGPTLEFYTVVSNELQKEELGLWRSKGTVKVAAPDSDMKVTRRRSRSSKTSEGATSSGASGKAYVEYVVPTGNGLFPAPLSSKGDESKEESSVLEMFLFLGRLTGKALTDGRLLDLRISDQLNELIIACAAAAARKEWKARTKEDFSSFKMPFVNRDLRSLAEVDPALALSLRNMSKMDPSTVEDLYVFFVVPGNDNVELVPGGRERQVKGDNLGEYIEAVTNHVLFEGVWRQAAEFVKGFNEVLDCTALLYFLPSELNLVFCGPESEKWTVSFLANSTRCDHGFTQDSNAVLNLFKILSELDADERRKFLQFATGSPRLPFGGLANLQPRLTIVRRTPEDGRKVDETLPTVMTCTNYLKLPDYSSFEITKERLLYAIREGQGSFDLS